MSLCCLLDAGLIGVVQDGVVSMFDLDHETDGDDGASEVAAVGPSLKFKAHDGTPVFYLFPDVDSKQNYDCVTCADAIGSVSFHPLHPLLLSVSGSRHFQEPSSSESDDSDSDDEELPRPRKNAPHPVPLDTSVKMWSFETAGEPITI